MTTFDHQIAANARTIRLALGLTLREVSKRATEAGFTLALQQVHYAETGKRPASRKIDALAAGLGVTVDNVIQGTIPAQSRTD